MFNSSMVEYTYYSRDTEITLQSGHFVFNENAINIILAYDSLDAANNF